MPHQWFYASNGGQMGPVDASELKQLATAGTVKPADLVWRDGLSEWTPASKVTGLFATADAAPVASLSGIGPPPAAAQPYAAPASGYAPPGSVLPYQGGGRMGETVGPRTIELLRQTRPWVMLFSVLMFIVAGLAFVGGLIMAGLGFLGGARAMGVAAMVGVVYVLMGLLYFIPALHLGRYGSRIGTLAMTRRADTLDSALEAQKSFWKFLGILTLILIGIYVVIFVVLIGLGVAAGGM